MLFDVSDKPTGCRSVQFITINHPKVNYRKSITQVVPLNPPSTPHTPLVANKLAAAIKITSNQSPSYQDKGNTNN